MTFDLFIGPNGKPCAKPTNNGTYDTEYFLDKMERVAHVPRGSGMSVLQYLGDFLADALSRGITVTLDGVGTFAPSLQIIGEPDGKRLDGNAVELKRITFRASPQLKKNVSRELVRRRVKVNQRKNLSVPDIDRRKDILVNLLQKKGFISSSNYMSAAHICRSQAYADLVEFEKGEVITAFRVGRNKIYRLKELAGVNGS